MSASRLSPFGLSLVSVLAIGLSGCQSWVNSDDILTRITPYQIEVVQGNVVTSDRVKALQVGMNREQVADIMGTPLITDAFHADRWDYVFTVRRQNRPYLKKVLTLDFKGEQLASIQGEDMPTEREFVAEVDPFKPNTNPPKLVLSADERAALPVSPRAAAAAPKPPVTGRSYPPLETAP